MNKYFIFLLVFSLNSILSYSQEIRYLDKKGNQVNRRRASIIESTFNPNSNHILLIKQNKKNDTISYSNNSIKDSLVRDGITGIFYPSGKLHYKKNYADNKLNGQTICYYENGFIKSIILFRSDSIISAKSYGITGEPIEFVPDLEQPRFSNGSIDKFRQYIYFNVNYPIIATKYKISAKCSIKFTITKTGLVKNIEVDTPIIPFKNEIIRVLKKTDGKWKSGKQYGELEDQNIIFDINFQQ
jgi:hypothetical protein